MFWLQEDNPDHFPTGTPRLRTGYLGPTLDYCSDERATQLGDGVQEIPPGLQGSQLSR